MNRLARSRVPHPERPGPGCAASPSRAASDAITAAANHGCATRARDGNDAESVPA